MKLALGTLPSEANTHYSTADKNTVRGKRGVEEKRDRIGKKARYTT